MTNAIESGANPFGCTDYLNEKKNILATGSEVFEVSCGQSLHTKTILVDDHISMIGSYNLDLRSTYLDTELMLVIDCPELNQAYGKTHLSRQSKADMCCPMEQRTKGRIFKEKCRFIRKPVISFYDSSPASSGICCE